MRTVGAALTVAAVLALLASLVGGMEPFRDSPPPEVMVAAPVTTPEDPVRVEVINGAGIAGLAREVTEQLREQGFDVVYYGNADRSHPDSTVVLDRAGNPTAARSVAAALGLSRIQSAVDTTLYLEATVVLGVDWKEAGTGNRE